MLGYAPVWISIKRDKDRDFWVQRVRANGKELPSFTEMLGYAPVWISCVQRPMGVFANDCPDSCAKATKMCHSATFPNLYVVLQVACIIPVTSWDCERSAGDLRCLHNYTRANME